MISYAPFWHTLAEKDVSQYELIHNHGFSSGTLDAIRKGQGITTATLNHICRILRCDVSDVLCYVPDHDSSGSQNRRSIPSSSVILHKEAPAHSRGNICL